MYFEYDYEKSISNKKKHGIDFEEAKDLWNDNWGVVFPARSSDESRWFLIAIRDDVHWTAIFTVRNELIRIISVRRSRKEEKAIYEKK